jgi:hypothetical protein
MPPFLCEERINALGWLWICSKTTDEVLRCPLLCVGITLPFINLQPWLQMNSEGKILFVS